MAVVATRHCFLQTLNSGLQAPTQRPKRQNTVTQPLVRTISSINDRQTAPGVFKAESVRDVENMPVKDDRSTGLDSPFSLPDRAKYIPLRLTPSERKLMRLLEAALHVSDYTDLVDIPSCSSTRTERAMVQIQELCSILSGLSLTADYKMGQELLRNRGFISNEKWFARVFEIGRRYKMMNPDTMRDMYGKLMYLLMDAQSRDVHQLLGFSVVAPIVTVHSTLAQHGALAVLDDPRVTAATQDIPISPNSTNINRATVQEMVREKGRATEAIIAEYSGGETSESAFRATRDEIEKDRLQLSSGNPGAEDKTPPPEPMTSDLLRQCIYSINDYNTFLRTTREPCEIMIGYLKKYFSPNGSGHERDEYPSLTIKTGRDGAKLDHDHPKQYSYVLQSLNLWKETIENLPKLWYFAESDLLAPNGTYRFENTGQGWNRVQYAPKASQEMHAILRRAQRDFRSWIGSSVIHIGDHDVPNALFFIDKYCQIYRILWPITNVLAQIPIQGKVQEYAAHEFGSADGAIREILADSFKHAFDGSGAESYSHAGRCVDGSLTSGKYQASFLPTL